MITVFTCVFGAQTDPLHEPACPETDARFVCFTDQPIRSRRWQIQRMPAQERPTRAARLMKAMSHETVGGEWSLWIDANYTLLARPEDLLQHGEMVAFRHRDRSRITDECEEIVRLGKAKSDAVRAQLAAYQADGFDTDENPQQDLSCNGVILRRHTPAVIALNEMLAGELRRHTLRDQMSIDYCAWKLGMTINRWPGVHSDNPYFRHKHFRRPTVDF